MLRATRIAAVCLSAFLILAPKAARAEEAVIAERGEPRMAIVLARQATERQQQLAAQLADYLNRISGAQFPIRAGDGNDGIVLGTLDQFPKPEWTKPLAVNGCDGIEAYGVETAAKRILILGATDAGLDRGVTKLLETLGCRWFFPHAAWRITPKLERVAADLNLTDRPALLSRVIWYGWGYWDSQVAEDHQEWMRRNWLGESLKIRCGHAWQNIIRQHKPVFDQHPEYLALRLTQDEKTGQLLRQERGGEKFCISNPGVVDVCRQYAVKYFVDNPDADMVSMEPSDGGGHCQCDKCAEMGTVSDRVFYLVNEAAKAAAAEHPGKYVGTLAYSQHSEPPTFQMNPNVYVQITAGFTRGRYTFLELIEEWAKHVRQLGVYEYLNVWAWTRDMPGAARGANVAYLQERIPYYIAHNATTMSNESGSNFGANGLGYLVASRLMWNPKADVEGILQDFFEKSFEPAAAAMKRYYERFDGGSSPLLSDHLLGLAYQDVAEAGRLAADLPDVLRRLDDVKLYLHYVSLMRDLEVSGADRDRRLQALFPVLNFAYRTRHRYIVNSAAVRGRYQTYYLRNIEQPADWDYTKTRGKAAWCVGEDFTPEEVDSLFTAGLARYQPQDFEQRTFSDNLAPGGFAPAPGGLRARWRFQGMERFLMHSRTGEPLQFRLETGVIAHYRDRRPTVWKISRGDDQEVATGELTLDGQWHDVQFRPDQPGAYWLEINDFGAGWGIDYAPGKPYVWRLEKGKDLHTLGSTIALYFYVPKGAKTVAYYVQGGEHRVSGGDGQEIAKIGRQPGNVVVIDVPPGEDGRVWRLENLGLGKLWFYNCPNYLSAGAEDMLTPQPTAP